MWFYVYCGFILRNEANGYVGRLWFYSYCDNRYVVLSRPMGYMCSVMCGHVGENWRGRSCQETALSPGNTAQAPHRTRRTECTRTIVQSC